MAYFVLAVVFSFSGIPEFVSGVLLDESPYTAIHDDADNQETEDTSEKEEKSEKEDVKESLIAEDVFLAGLHAGPSLEIYNGILRVSGYYAEDHYPPPERA